MLEGDPELSNSGPVSGKPGLRSQRLCASVWEKACLVNAPVAPLSIGKGVITMDHRLGSQIHVGRAGRGFLETETERRGPPLRNPPELWVLTSGEGRHWV